MSASPPHLPPESLPPPAPPTPPEDVEDAASQALAEALRSSFFILKIIMIGLVVVFLGSGFFTVGTQEKALILRLGKPVAEDESALLGPGAHWAFPYPIDEVVRIPVGEVQTLTSTIGWWKTTPAQEAAGTEPPPGPTLRPDQDGYLLTRDGGLVHARATLRYRIAEPGLHYLFGLAHASNLVQNALNSALVRAAALSTVEITRDSTGFREHAARRLQELIAEQRLGIVVDQLAVTVVPPRQVREDFERVLRAEVQRDTTVRDAQQYANATTNQALAEARARVNLAEAERQNLLEFVGAEAKRFTDLLPEYRRHPQLFTELRLAEALQRIYTNVTERIILQERADQRARELRLLLSREPPRLKLPETPKPADHH